MKLHLSDTVLQQDETTLDFYITSSSVRDGDEAGAKALKCSLDEVITTLKEALQGDNLLEAKSWLAASIGRRSNVTSSQRSACFGGLVEATTSSRSQDRARGALLQILQMLCEHRRVEVAQLISEPRVLHDFFRGSDVRLARWFGHFSMEGMSKFTHGAFALAHWALAERAEAWQHLVWAGRHPQAPVAVATKTHYFCELDLLATMHHLLEHCPDFWSSSQLAESLRDGAFLELDRDYFCQVLLDMLSPAGGSLGSSSARQLQRLLERYINEESWQLLCRRLLHHLDDKALLRVVNAMADARSLNEPPAAAAGRRTGASGVETTAPTLDVQDLSHLVFSRHVEWSSLPDVLLCHALACQRGQLWKVLCEDEDQEDALRSLTQAAERMHGRGAQHSPQAHKTLLRDIAYDAESLSGPSACKPRMRLLAELWSVRLRLHQLFTASDRDDGLLQTAAAACGATCSRVATTGGGTFPAGGTTGGTDGGDLISGLAGRMTVGPVSGASCGAAGGTVGEETGGATAGGTSGVALHVPRVGPSATVPAVGLVRRGETRERLSASGAVGLEASTSSGAAGGTRYELLPEEEIDAASDLERRGGGGGERRRRRGKQRRRSDGKEEKKRKHGRHSPASKRHRSSSKRRRRKRHDSPSGSSSSGGSSSSSDGTDSEADRLRLRRSSTGRHSKSKKASSPSPAGDVVPDAVEGCVGDAGVQDNSAAFELWEVRAEGVCVQGAADDVADVLACLACRCWLQTPTSA